MKKILTILLVALIACTAVFAQASKEVSYPEKSINLIVPYGAGGTTDLTARAIANGMATKLGVTINVNNVAGAGGSTGTLQVENGKNDGYTILANGMLALTTMPVNGYTKKTFRDWDIWVATYAPNAIVVPANSPYKTVDDLIADMQKRPGQVTFGTAGIGSGGHFGAEVLKAVSGADYNHITYAGGGPAVNAVLAGEIDVCPQLLAETKDHIISGKLRCLCVLAEEDIEIAPGVVCPSIMKSNYKTAAAKFVPMGEVTAICVPKGLDESVLSKLDEAFDYAAKQKEVSDFCDLKSFSLIPMNRADSQKYLEKFASKACYILWDAGACANNPADFKITR
ncbi:MAG: tripartite tricarboxylate transporter substrate binding protein [Sphaerochaetaceae bacterium]|nr:tripartite tricarboxylate transporter substrate binding protein [Sphaerochaetaceae bacterium]